MLALTARKDEQIFIGDNGEIVLTILECRSDRVRIGFAADRSIPINRGVVWLKMLEERKEKSK